MNTNEKLVGYLSYVDKYNRYHITNLSEHDYEKWPKTKDYYNMNKIKQKYTEKVALRMINKDDYTECQPWEKNGFYFSLSKDIEKIAIEKVYNTSDLEEKKEHEYCDIKDLIGHTVIIDSIISVYNYPKFKKIGCIIKCVHIRNLEPIIKDPINLEERF